MITLAFYKGKGGFIDRLIRWTTQSRYSHVEIIQGKAVYDVPTLCYSSSGRDGGVRAKQITPSADKWDLVPIPSNREIMKIFQEEQGAKYDFAAIFWNHCLRLFGREHPQKWFCSEFCAAALGINNPHKLSPQDLYDVVIWRIEQKRKAIKAS